jgi:hypothetical protein
VGSASIGEWGVDLPVTVPMAALVTSPLEGEGAACIAQIRHNIMYISNPRKDSIYIDTVTDYLIMMLNF